MLKIQEFILEHLSDYKTLLSQKPYCLAFDEDEDLILLKYNQIDSDFSNPIVQECRGIILEKKTVKVVCFPFKKFFNYNDPLATKIEWESARVQEKIDGSIISYFYYENKWHLKTNGTLNAYTCNLQMTINEIQTYGDLFDIASKNQGLDITKLNKEYTYIFEIVSKFNRVVVPYTETKIYHIGTRDNISYQELEEDIGIDKPKRYSFNTFEEIVEHTKVMSFSEEGYVVVDKDWNRVKIKSIKYLIAHRLVNNHQMSKNRFMDLIKTNEDIEFLLYFPEYSEISNALKQKLSDFIDKIIKDMEKIDTLIFSSRKEYASYVQKETTMPALMFMYYENKIKKEEVKKYILEQPSDKIIKWLQE